MEDEILAIGVFMFSSWILGPLEVEEENAIMHGSNASSIVTESKLSLPTIVVSCEFARGDPFR